MRHWVKEVVTANMHKLPPLQYKCRLERMRDNPVLQACFTQSEYDEGTALFFDTYCRQAPIARNLASPFLQMVMSRTDANALLGRGQMHVLTTEQARRLLGHWEGPSERDSGESAATVGPWRMLDVGAGDGNVTRQLAPLVDEVVTTEVSTGMVRRLRAGGFRCAETVDLTPAGLGAALGEDSPSEPFDLVACCNILDRCSKPKSLLRDMRNLLRPPGGGRPGGRLLLAVVLPFSPFVEMGTQKVAPEETLPMRGGRCVDRASFERAVQVMAEKVLEPAGFVVESWTRLPYLSAGDLTYPYYVLNDAVFVLSRTPADPADDGSAGGDGDSDGTEGGGGGGGGAAKERKLAPLGGRTLGSPGGAGTAGDAGVAGGSSSSVPSSLSAQWTASARATSVAASPVVRIDWSQKNFLPILPDVVRAEMVSAGAMPVTQDDGTDDGTDGNGGNGDVIEGGGGRGDGKSSSSCEDFDVVFGATPSLGLGFSSNETCVGLGKVGLKVATIVEGMAAAKSGMIALQDVVVAVNGTDVRGMTKKDTIEMILAANQDTTASKLTLRFRRSMGGEAGGEAGGEVAADGKAGEVREVWRARRAGGGEGAGIVRRTVEEGSPLVDLLRKKRAEGGYGKTREPAWRAPPQRQWGAAASSGGVFL